MPKQSEPSALRQGEYTIHDRPAISNGGTLPPLSRLLLAFGLLALLVYPFVAIADLMSLAGHSDGTETAQSHAVMRTLICSTLAYPVVYVLCLALTRLAASRRHSAMSIVTAAFPIIYVALIVNFFFWANGHIRH